MALLTVLMPVYNAEKFLREAINSILGQTLHDFEFLIIDDASTDNSVAIIESYNDARIKFVKNRENMGISRTLNKGIDLANTELVARMDADDISHPQRLQKQYEFMQNNPGCALLSCWVKVISEDKQQVRSEQFKSEYYYYNMIFDCWMYHPTVMYRKAAVKDVGGYKSTYAEDFDLFWHLSRKYKIDNIEEPLLDYRITSQSLHQVIHKKEYDEALLQQVKRNIDYYTGGSLELTNAELECIRFNFEPLLQLGSVFAVVKTLRKLDRLNVAVLATPNVNLNIADTTMAAWFRRTFITRFFKKHFSPGKLLLFKILLKLAKPRVFPQ